jgi:hypothetical protein
MRSAIDRLSTTVWVVTLLTASLGRACCGDASPAKPHTTTGTVKLVDERERTITLNGFLSTRRFNVGDHCKVSLEDKPDAALKDLHPGYRVEVQYVARNGVKVASRIAQMNAAFTGHITAIDPARRALTVKSGVTRKAFVAGDGCKIVLRDDKDHTLADLKVGHKVTVRYTAAGGSQVAHKIEQGSLTFAGTVEAIDATTGMLKAKHLLSDRRFTLAKDCQLIIDGRLNGQLSDLRIGDKLWFHYEDVDGVLVANRVEREGPATRAEAGRTGQTTEPGAYGSAK